MVILLDLEDESIDPPIEHIQPLELPSTDPDEDEEIISSNPHADAFATALSCYPVVSSVARHLDLNTLHDLAATCRQFRDSLLPYRSQLKKQTLRCINDDVDMSSRLADRLRESHMQMRAANGLAWSGSLTSGRVGLCARDLVGECRRCGMIVCRNCTIKSPAAPALKARHRRLCKTCQKAPLRTIIPGPNQHDDHAATFTADAFSRGPCTCPDSVYICLSCGNAMRGADTTYMRGWTWRTRYSTYLGGLGTGIGEGNEGVACGREAACLAARELEKEIDCCAEELTALRALERASTPGREWAPGTSYMTQEIEGIGGIVKKKVKKRVRVGAVVKEYEDEREHGGYLSREQEGANRSWCHWCARVVLGRKDREGGSADMRANGLTRTITDDSSSSSISA